MKAKSYPVENGAVMTSLYIASISIGGGKTTLCAGLGQRLKARGKHVGYLKPLAIHQGQVGNEVGDKDAEFIKQVLALKEPLETLCPISLSAGALGAGKKGAPRLKEIKTAYSKVSRGKDVVLMEGAGDFRDGSDSAQAALQIVESLAARVILIARYSIDLEAEQIIASARLLADYLLGVVINAVPESRMKWARDILVPSLEQNRINVLGVLPEDRLLFTVSIGELAQHLGGDILNNPERSDELVENLMVGAMSVDPALSYLSLKSNKAVITRGDRPDIQLAALETSTRCLVLTDNIQPMPMILNRAQEQGIPIVAVKSNTLSTMEAVADIFNKSRFYQERKLEVLDRLLEKHIDLDTIYSAI